MYSCLIAICFVHSSIFSISFGLNFFPRNDVVISNIVFSLLVRVILPVLFIIISRYCFNSLSSTLYVCFVFSWDYHSCNFSNAYLTALEFLCYPVWVFSKFLYQWLFKSTVMFLTKFSHITGECYKKTSQLHIGYKNWLFARPRIKMMGKFVVYSPEVRRMVDALSLWNVTIHNLLFNLTENERVGDYEIRHRIYIALAFWGFI